MKHANKDKQGHQYEGDGESNKNTGIKEMVSRIRNKNTGQDGESNKGKQGHWYQGDGVLNKNTGIK